MNCPICGSLSFKHMYELPNGKIVECIKCGTVCRENLVSGELAHRMYEDDNYLNSTFFEVLKVGAKTNVEPYLVYNKVLQRLEGMVERKSRLLDIGCSYGAFIDTARQHGWDVFGVDISKKACSYASEEQDRLCFQFRQGFTVQNTINGSSEEFVGGFCEILPR